MGQPEGEGERERHKNGVVGGGCFGMQIGECCRDAPRREIERKKENANKKKPERK